MTKLTDEQLDNMANLFRFKALRERFNVFERYFKIEEGDVVVDAGAFIGDSLPYFSKKVGKTGKVYAFEPLEANYRRLLRFIRYAMLNNVHPYKIALWNEKITLPFYLSEYSNAGSLLSEFRKVGSEHEQVQADALDNIINDVNYIWMNIEGSEVDALKGAEDLLMGNDVRLLISCHRVTDNYDTVGDVREILDDYGYRTELVEGHSYWVYAEGL